MKNRNLRLLVENNGRSPWLLPTFYHRRDRLWNASKLGKNRPFPFLPFRVSPSLTLSPLYRLCRSSPTHWSYLKFKTTPIRKVGWSHEAWPGNRTRWPTRQLYSNPSQSITAGREAGPCNPTYTCLSLLLGCPTRMPCVRDLPLCVRPTQGGVECGNGNRMEESRRRWLRDSLGLQSRWHFFGGPRPTWWLVR